MVQVVMADRAHAYREHQELLEAYSLKKLSLYVFYTLDWFLPDGFGHSNNF